MAPLNRERPVVLSSAAAIQATLSSFFDQARANILAQLTDALGKVAKADNEGGALEDARRKRLEEILSDLDFSEWIDLQDGIESHLMVVAKDSAKEGLLQVDIDPTQDMTDQASADAIAYAKDRSAEMVGKKWVDGELVDNPDAQWVISDSTREFLRSDVQDAMTEGWSNDQLADALADNYTFSDKRAEVIARTETAKADVQGNLAGWNASGVVSGRQFLAAPDCCDECQEFDGDTAALDEDLPGGDAPIHPQCRCNVLPVLMNEGNDDDNQA